MINSIKCVTIGVSFLILLPTASYASNECSNFSPNVVNQVVSAELEVWGGRVRILDLLSGEKPANDQPIPMYFTSISNAIETQKDKQGDSITLGEIFPVYTIAHDKLLSYDNKDSFLSLTEFTGTWFIPAFIKDRVIAIIEASCVDNQLKVVSIGAKPLAEAISFNKSPTAKKKRFVRIHYPMSDFFATEQDIGEVIYPLTFYKKYLTMKPKDSVGGGYAPESVMTILGNELRSQTN